MPDAPQIHSCQIGRAPVAVLKLLARAWLDLLKAGHSDGLPYMWDHEVLWIEQGNRPVACLTWQFSNWNGRAFIQVGYVLPTYRGGGLYQQLYADAKKRAVAKGAVRIEGCVATGNKAMERVCVALGRTAAGTVWGEDLPKQSDKEEGPDES